MTRFALVLPLLLAGCVTQATFDRKADEALRLEQTVAALEAEYAALEDRNLALLADRADLNQKLAGALQEISRLHQDLLRVEADRARAERLFASRDARAGQELTELRQTIDRLTEENRVLAAELAAERQERESQLAEIKGTYDELVGMLESEIARGEVTISELEGQLTVNLVESILFDSGQAVVKPEGFKVLREVGRILKGAQEKEIRVEGHTDNVPISARLKATFPSNWELSTARAANVVHFLQETAGIPGERLAIVGFGEHRPIASNATAKGREQNRRIQIVLVPHGAARVAPAP